MTLPHGPIPLDLVLSGRDVTEPRPSPDGRRVAFVARWRGASAIFDVSIDGASPERMITTAPAPAPGRGLGGGCFDWLPDSSGVLYAAADGELWLLLGIEATPLTAHQRSCQAPAVGAIGGEPVVAYAVDQAEVWLAAIDGSWARRLDDGRHEFSFDPAISPDGSMVSWQGWSPPWMPWDAAERVDCMLGDASGRGTPHITPHISRHITVWKPPNGAVQQPRFAPDGTPAHVHDGSGWLNVHVGGRAVVAEPVEHASATWGMGQRSYAVGADGTVAFTRNRDGAGELCAARPGRPTEVLDDRHVWGQLSIVGTHVVGLRSAPARPAEIAALDLAGGPASVAAAATVLAASGVAGWSQVPAPRIDRRPAGPGRVPMRRYRATGVRRGTLCWVHGGPTDQWRDDFRPRLDYWRTRGWDILLVDHRGSTGYGREFQQALHRSWGRGDVDDVAAALADAHSSGRSSAPSTVIVGGSAGGSAVLGVLADHPQLVAGGIASYPASDLADLADRSHRYEAHYTDTLVGPRDDAAAFRRLSVIHRAAQIRKPLLLFHGSEDPVVPPEQSDALAAAIRSSGGSVDHVVYEGEGHGFRDPDNVRDEYARAEAFLAEVVGTAPVGGRR